MLKLKKSQYHINPIFLFFTKYEKIVTIQNCLLYKDLKRKFAKLFILIRSINFV